MSTLKRYNGTDWVPIGPALINADGNMFENIVASKYSPTANYQLNSYVIYNNKFYKCIVPITVAEPWNPNHWEETLVSNELGVGSGNKIFEVSFGGIDDTSSSHYYEEPDVYCNRVFSEIRDALSQGYSLIAKILIHFEQNHSDPEIEEEYIYAPIKLCYYNSDEDPNDLYQIQTAIISSLYHWDAGDIKKIEYTYHWADGLSGRMSKLYDSSNLTTVSNRIPTANSTIDSAGLITFKNLSNNTLFTIQLPLYNGGVE